MHARFGIYGLFLALCSPAFGQDFYSGDGQGKVVTQLGIAFRGAPLLDGFYFRFRNTDHHFGFIEAGADRPFVNQLTAGFADKNSDDHFDYALSFHPRFGTKTVGSTGNLRGVGEIRLPLPRPDSRSVFVLRGFRIGWADADHHIERLALFEADGELTVALEGGKGGLWLSSSEFRAQVDYAYVPRSMVRFEWMRDDRVESGGADEEIIARGTSVLAGFDLRFTNGDHHIREVGVWTPDDGRVQVFFSDKNADDGFVWTVKGILLNRERLTGIDRPVPEVRPEEVEGPSGSPPHGKPSPCTHSCGCRAER